MEEGGYQPPSFSMIFLQKNRLRTSRLTTNLQTLLQKKYFFNTPKQVRGNQKKVLYLELKETKIFSRKQSVLLLSLNEGRPKI